MNFVMLTSLHELSIGGIPTTNIIVVDEKLSHLFNLPDIGIKDAPFCSRINRQKIVSLLFQDSYQKWLVSPSIYFWAVMSVKIKNSRNADEITFLIATAACPSFYRGGVWVARIAR